MLDMLQETLDRTSKLVAGVAPDRLDARTPCTEWNVRALLNHMIGGNLMFAKAARGESVDPAMFTADHVGDNPTESYNASAEAALDAWRQPGVMEKTIHLPFGDMPGAVVV